MVKIELLDYIKGQLSIGVEIEKIKEYVLSKGFSTDDFDEAINQVAQDLISKISI
jgi:DNA-binding transcriptional MerR regulator